MAPSGVYSPKLLEVARGGYRGWTLNALLLVGVVLWVLRLTGTLVGP